MPEPTKHAISKRFKPRLVKPTKKSLKTAPTPTSNHKKKRPILRIVVTKTTTLASLIGLIFIAPPSNASSIDPVNQTYTVKETDDLGDGLSLRRTYSSGSVFRGNFGTGWCSELDQQVQIYDGGDLRLRGCDLETADLLDGRETAKSIRRVATGFTRKRGDGATELFDSGGYLERIIRKTSEISIERDNKAYVTRISVQTKRFDRTFKIELSAGREEPGLTRILSIGEFSYTYQNEDLVAAQGRKSTTRYAYDDTANMVSRITPLESENIQYDGREDRVIFAARTGSFGRERILLSSRRTENSVIEMTIEVERGAEMHPVRILYNITNGRLSLEGDRGAARQILNWLKA